MQLFGIGGGNFPPWLCPWERRSHTSFFSTTPLLSPVITQIYQEASSPICNNYKVICFLQAFEELADWVLLTWLCDDS